MFVLMWATLLISVRGNSENLSQKLTLMVPPLTEGQQTTLTCTVPGLCSGSDPDITWTCRRAGEKDSNITGNITANQGQTSNLTVNSSAEHHGTEVTCKVSFNTDTATEKTVTLNVTYVKEVKISGNTKVKKGDVLNLTCDVDNFRGSNKSGYNTSPHENKNVSASLIISNMTADNFGLYICTKVKKVNSTSSPPKILSNSSCWVQSEVLMCECISEGFPSPTITLMLLEHLVNTTVSHHRVRSTFNLPVKELSNTQVVTCVSTNGNGEVKHNLTITSREKKGGDLLQTLLMIVQQPQIIIAFLVGMLFSATICCLIHICHRNKKKTSRNLAESLEMVTTQAVPLINDGQAVEASNVQHAAEGGAEAAGQLAPDGDVHPKEVEYSDINFSALKRTGPTEAKEIQNPPETEYAEIKREALQKRQDNDGGEEGEVLSSNEEETELRIPEMEAEKGEEGGEGAEGGDEGADVAVYSNVDELMGET